MSFGTYPLVTLADAREKRGEARKQVANGIDPVSREKGAKAAQKLSVENSFEVRVNTRTKLTDGLAC